VGLAVTDIDLFVDRFEEIEKKSPQEVAQLYDFQINGLPS
jgi:hypothetical protein